MTTIGENVGNEIAGHLREIKGQQAAQNDRLTDIGTGIETLIAGQQEANATLGRMDTTLGRMDTTLGEIANTLKEIRENTAKNA